MGRFRWGWIFQPSDENELGQDPLIIDAVEDGGIAGRVVQRICLCRYQHGAGHDKSDPAGFVADSSNYGDEQHRCTTSPSMERSMGTILPTGLSMVFDRQVPPVWQ